MNRKQYIQPATESELIRAALPIAASNEVDGDHSDPNPSTMEEGDGDDAVKDRYDDWGNLW